MKAVDYVIIAVYLVCIAAIGLAMSRRQKTTADYFVAGGRIPAWALSFSLMATIISSVTLVAIPGAAFRSSFYLMMPNLAVPFVLILVALVVVPFYRNTVRMSAYEYIGRRFGVTARVYSSAAFLINRMQDVGFTVLTTAIAVSVMTGWDIRLVIVASGVYQVTYTMIGGIEGVIWTDVVQGVILLGGGLVVLFTVLFMPPGGPAAVFAEAHRAGKFGLGNFEMSWASLFRDTPTAWILLAVGIVGVTRAYTAEQSMVQRYLVARTDRDAKIGVFTGSVVCLPIWFLFAFIGAALWSYYRLTGDPLPASVAAKPDNILPYFIVTHLPTGLVGLFLAAILAAAQSSVSSDLNSVATVVTTDYYAQLRPKASERARLMFGRFMVLVAGVVASSVALLLTLSGAPSLLDLSLTLWMIVSAGVLRLFALGFLTHRATSQGACVGIAACVVFTAWAVATGAYHVDLGINYTMNPKLIGIWGQVVMFGVGYLASVVLGGQRPDLAGLTFRTRNAGVRPKDDRECAEAVELRRTETMQECVRT